MWKRASNTSGGGGTVKTGTFEISNAASGGTGSFDTGLGSAIKRIVIVGELPNSTSGKFSVVAWDNYYADGFKYVRDGSAGTGASASINTANNFTLYLTKRPDTNNGVVEFAYSTLSPTGKNGTYYWYAE